MERIEGLLRKQDKPVTERTPKKIAFDDPLWRNPLGANWRPLVIYDHGHFWVEQGPTEPRLRYDLRSLHGMVFCLFAAGMFFCIGLTGGSALRAAGFALLAFGWLYGMNMLLALIRIPLLIRKTLRAT